MPSISRSFPDPGKDEKLIKIQSKISNECLLLSSHCKVEKLQVKPFQMVTIWPATGKINIKSPKNTHPWGGF
jgi:hypothetical protein